MISARVIKDSINAKTGKRLTTIICKFHRFILPEVLTHRDFSRNTASSRAIPVQKQIDEIIKNPAMPIFWGKAQRGMSAYESVGNEIITPIEIIWTRAMRRAVSYATNLASLGLHKQLTNRLLEPYMWTTMYISSTRWDNFFMLRRPPNGVMDPQFPAQPEIQQLAIEIYNAIQTSQPEEKQANKGIESWHIPFISSDELSTCMQSGVELSTMLSASAGRAARVSYGTEYSGPDSKTSSSIDRSNHKPDVQTDVPRQGTIYESHESKESTITRRDTTTSGEFIAPENHGSLLESLHSDIELGRRLMKDKHMSPFEHSAMCLDTGWPYSNFQGWVQHRRYIELGINPEIDL